MVKAVTIIVTILLLGAMIITPFGPARVISGSMEPEIRTGSTIFLVPAKEIFLNDIIVFHPSEVGREMIVHRVIKITPEGFITKGDASNYTDQDHGEPPVTNDRIEGKVLVVGSEIPQIDYNTFMYLIMGLCILLGIVWTASGIMTRKRLLRVRHVQSFILVFSVIVVFFTVIFGSGTQTLSYLSSMNPGDRFDHVKVGESGEIALEGRNRSLIPTLIYVEGPVSTNAQLVLPFSDFTAKVEVPAQNKTGWFEIKIQQYTYPVAMPPFIIDFLHGISPYFAMLMVVTFIMAIIHFIVNILESWMPLSLIGGKKISRSYRRFKRSLIS